MKAEIILFLLLVCVLVRSEHLILGDASKKQLVFHTKAEYHYIPFVKRVKEVFFSSPDQRPISAIMAYDNIHSKATANITAGGVGATFVNIRLKSERGSGLDYDIGIYAEHSY